MQTECINFSVDNSKINTVKMENKPVYIPNTGSMVNKLIMVFGLIFVLVGGGIVTYFTFYKRKNIKTEA